MIDIIQLLTEADACTVEMRGGEIYIEPRQK
jgi:hypothetical protein